MFCIYIVICKHLRVDHTWYLSFLLHRQDFKQISGMVLSEDGMEWDEFDLVGLVPVIITSHSRIEMYNVFLIISSSYQPICETEGIGTKSVRLSSISVYWSEQGNPCKTASQLPRSHCRALKWISGEQTRRLVENNVAEGGAGGLMRDLDDWSWILYLGDLCIQAWNWDREKRVQGRRSRKRLCPNLV